MSLLRRSQQLVTNHILSRRLAGFPGVDGQYSVTSKESRQSLSVNLNKNSKLRAILISIDVLTGSNNTVDKAAAQTARSRVTTSEEIESGGSVKTKTKNRVIEGVTDVKAKYMDKLKHKLQQGTPHAAGKSADQSFVRRRGDSALLEVAQQVTAREAADKKKHRGAWMLLEGMGALLDYCQHRTMIIGLMSSLSSSTELMEQFLSNVDLTFDYVQNESWLRTDFDNMDVMKSMNFSEKQKLVAAIVERMNADLAESPAFVNSGILPKQVLFVAGDDLLLSAAKKVGFFTLKYRGPTGLFGQVVTDFSAKTAVEVQDALEELNGVALRDSAFAHRST